MIHVERRDSRRTTWFTSNYDSRLADIFLVEKNYADLWWRWELILLKKTLPKLRNSWLSLGSNAVCFLCRFNSFSPGQIAIHVGNSGIHENPRFPPLSMRTKFVEYSEGRKSLRKTRFWPLIRYERKTSFRPRESRDLGNWGLCQGYAKSLDNDGIIKFRR